jgi:arylsulfatase A-like enzyme
VNTVNGAPDLHNPADPVSGYAGIPRNMTTIAQLMQGAGYETHMYGKWDAGMATPEHTPHGRGYEHQNASFGATFVLKRSFYRTGFRLRDPPD